MQDVGPNGKWLDWKNENASHNLPLDQGFKNFVYRRRKGWLIFLWVGGWRSSYQPGYSPASTYLCCKEGTALEASVHACSARDPVANFGCLQQCFLGHSKQQPSFCPVPLLWGSTRAEGTALLLARRLAAKFPLDQHGFAFPALDAMYMSGRCFRKMHLK